MTGDISPCPIPYLIELLRRGSQAGAVPLTILDTPGDSAMTSPPIHLRLRLYSSSHLSLPSLVEELADSCRVAIQSISRQEGAASFAVRQLTRTDPLDVELSGPIQAVQCWLQQLEGHAITIQGKGHCHGDGWYC